MFLNRQHELLQLLRGETPQSPLQPLLNQQPKEDKGIEETDEKIELQPPKTGKNKRRKEDYIRFSVSKNKRIE